MQIKDLKEFEGLTYTKDDLFIYLTINRDNFTAEITLTRTFVKAFTKEKAFSYIEQVFLNIKKALK